MLPANLIISIERMQPGRGRMGGWGRDPELGGGRGMQKSVLAVVEPQRLSFLSEVGVPGTPPTHTHTPAANNNMG